MLGISFTTAHLKRMLFLITITMMGTFLYALGVNLFLVPHHFLSGGITGIAMILYYLMDLPIGISNFLLNIPLLFLSLRYMGKLYTVVTILGTVGLSLFIDLTSYMATWNVVKDPMVAAISGGVILGLSLGILYRYNSNTGGLDVVGAVCKKYFNLEIGYVVFAMNFLIIAASAFIFTLEPAICTLISMYISAVVSGRIVIGFAQRKAAFIVSDKPLAIQDSILRHIRHGTTLLYGQGGFSGQDKKIVFAIVDLTQITRLRQHIEAIDPHAFLFIMNTTDVIGRGFTSPLNHAHLGTTRYTIDEDGKLVPSRSWALEMEIERKHTNP